MADWAALQIGGLLYLIMPVVTWLAMSGRQTRAGMAWCLGGLLMGLGMMAFGWRGAVPDWLALHIGMPLILLACAVRLYALSGDLGLVLPWRWVGLWLLAVVCVSVLGDVWEIRLLQALSNRFNIGAMFGLLSWAAWRLGRKSQSHNMLAIALLYALLTCVMLVNVVLVVLDQGARPDLVVSPSTGWLGGLVAVMGHLAYLGYVFEQSLSRRQAFDREVAADQEVAALNQRLASLSVRAQAGERAALVAHEVNQPLAAIQIHVQLAQRMLRKPSWDREVLQELLNKVMLQIERLEGWLDRLRSQHWAEQSVCAATDPRQVMHEALDLLRLDPRFGGVVFEVLKEESAPVRLSAGELSQLWFNLLRNAAEAAALGPEGRVVLSLERRGDSLVMEVRDNGPGFPPDMLAQVGRPFVSTKPQGMGVGLAICLKLVQQAGGQLVASNLTPAGARVEAVLPIHS
jgi:signal transduction histidine kinase